MADTNASSEVQVVEGPPADARVGGKKTAPAKGATNRGRTTKNYSDVECVIVCQAFMSASETYQGKSMKQTDFMESIGQNYVRLCKEQLERDQAAYSEQLRVTGQRSTVDLLDPKAPKPYSSSLLSKFRNDIAPDVTKFATLHVRFPIGTGETPDMYRTRLLAQWKRVNGNSDFKYEMCYDYLKDMPRWAEYSTSNSGQEGNEKKPRPRGKHSAAVDEKDKDVIKSLAREASKDILNQVVGQEDAKSTMYSGIGQFLQTGMEYLKTMSLPTPERNEQKRLQAEIQLEDLKLQLVEKRMKREALERKIPQSIGVASGSNSFDSPFASGTVTSLSGSASSTSSERASNNDNNASNSFASPFTGCSALLTAAAAAAAAAVQNANDETSENEDIYS
jgi:hypothetical protein